MAKIRLRYVQVYRDRHGKVRRYARVPGRAGVPLPGLPGSPEFMAAYAAAISGADAPRRPGALPGSFAALIDEFARSPEWSNLSSSSRRTYRSVLNKLRSEIGGRSAAMPQEAAREIITAIGTDRPAMANLTRAVLRRLMAFAVKIGQAQMNPVTDIGRYKTGTHHTWTDDEIATYEARWPIGTRERLTMALLLYTGQRVGDAARITRGHIAEGVIRLVQQKTAAEVEIPVAAQLAQIVRSTPALGIYVVTDAAGRPVTGDTLGTIIRKAADAAGLPRGCVAHGLRKAMARRLAERSASTKGIAAVLGHKTLAQVSLYTEAADRARLARDAIGRLGDGDRNKD